MPIPSFQRNWQTLKSSVFGHNLTEKFKNSESDDSQVISSQIKDDDISKTSPYQVTPEETLTATKYATATPENCDKLLETKVNVDIDMEQQKTTNNVIQKISVKSEKELQEPSKLILDIDQMRESTVGKRRQEQ